MATEPLIFLEGLEPDDLGQPVVPPVNTARRRRSTAREWRLRVRCCASWGTRPRTASTPSSTRRARAQYLEYLLCTHSRHSIISLLLSNYSTRGSARRASSGRYTCAQVRARVHYRGRLRRGAHAPHRPLSLTLSLSLSLSLSLTLTLTLTLPYSNSSQTRTLVHRL